LPMSLNAWGWSRLFMIMMWNRHKRSLSLSHSLACMLHRMNKSSRLLITHALWNVHH
jgi:hypothetical protein